MNTVQEDRMWAYYSRLRGAMSVDQMITGAMLVAETKAENKDNGSKLIVFQDDQRKEFTFVKDFSLAEKSTSLMFLSMGADSVNLAGNFGIW